jgi:hypothetical protein
MIEEMDAAEPNSAPRGSELLLEHCIALDAGDPRPTAHERLERLVGGTLARFLVGALTGSPRARRPSLD